MKNVSNKELVSQMHEALLSKDVDYWATRTEEEISEAQKTCEMHWSTGWLNTLSSYDATLFLLIPVILLITGICVYFITHGIMSDKSTTLLFTVSMCLAAAFLIKLDGIQFNKWNLLLRAFRTLKEDPDACQEALELVEKYACVKAYRDRVLAEGRQLRGIDLHLMQSIPEAEQAREKQFARDSACKKLHGLDVSANLV